METYSYFLSCLLREKELVQFLGFKCINYMLFLYKNMSDTEIFFFIKRKTNAGLLFRFRILRPSTSRCSEMQERNGPSIVALITSSRNILLPGNMWESFLALCFFSELLCCFQVCLWWLLSPPNPRFKKEATWHLRVMWQEVPLPVWDGELRSSTLTSLSR